MSDTLEQAQRERRRQLKALEAATEAIREAVRGGNFKALELTRSIANDLDQLDEATVQRGLWLLLREGEVELTDDSRLQLVEEQRGHADA